MSILEPCTCNKSMTGFCTMDKNCMFYELIKEYNQQQMTPIKIEQGRHVDTIEIKMDQNVAWIEQGDEAIGVLPESIPAVIQALGEISERMEKKDDLCQAIVNAMGGMASGLIAKALFKDYIIIKR